MNKIYKVPSIKVDFLPALVIFFIIYTTIGFYFITSLNTAPILAYFSFWLLFLSPLVIWFVSRNKNLKITDSGIYVSMNNDKLDLKWEDIEKIGFQAISAKRIGVTEVFPYLAIKLKDVNKITELKSTKEFGFLLKKVDLANYNNQSDILDLYISMQHASEKYSDMPQFLSSRANFITKLPEITKI